MHDIEKLFKETSRLYNRNEPHSDACENLIFNCLDLLSNSSESRYFGDFSGRPRVSYQVFEASSQVSRPFRADLFIPDRSEFKILSDELSRNLKRGAATWGADEVTLATKVIYTSVMSFSCCIDLWKRSSRKTPGTFFEIYFASLIPKIFPDAILSKHIPLPGISKDEEDKLEDAEGVEDGDSSVATDLVISRLGLDRKIVIPLKITTRERIVQPFAHQRILDSAFGPNTYNSFLTCVSETQLDNKSKSVKQVCVPGTVKLFQKHLGNINGLYYCDVPQRYAAPDMAAYLPVKEVGEIFKDFETYFSS